MVKDFDSHSAKFEDWRFGWSKFEDLRFELVKHTPDDPFQGSADIYIYIYI